MEPMNTKQNGAGTSPISAERPAESALSAAAVEPVAPPPSTVEDLAEGCVRFVERALGVRLDYRPETLPLLDHYLEQARGATSERVEALPMVAHMAGAYFGEVIRRRHASWWRLDGEDPTYWQVQFGSVYLAFSPVLFVREALTREHRADAALDLAEDSLSGDPAALELEEDDREAVAARLAELPSVSENEYYAPSTRLEVIDIAVDAIRSRRLAAGEDTDIALDPGDYERGGD